MTLNELSLRFLLLFVSILVLYFFSNRKDNQTINPLIVVIGFCVFVLCYLFTQVEIGVGIGFGMFAIFSILRFRARTFSTNAIVFLFTTITLSILDILHPKNNIENLYFFQILIISLYIIAVFIIHFNQYKFKKTTNIKLNYGLQLNTTEAFLRTQIQEKINISEFDFKLISVNTISNEIEIKIYF